MQYKLSFLVILLICAAIGIAGCTGTTSTPATQPATAGTAAATQASPTSAQNNLVVSPTDVVPDNNAVTVFVQEKDYLGQIPVVMGAARARSW